MDTSSIFGKLEIIVWARRITLGALCVTATYVLLIWLATKSSIDLESLDGALGDILSALDPEEPSAVIGALWSLITLSLLPVGLLTYLAAVPLLCFRLARAAQGSVQDRRGSRLHWASVLVFGAMFYILSTNYRFWSWVRGEELDGMESIASGRWLEYSLVLIAAAVFGTLCAYAMGLWRAGKTADKLSLVSEPPPGKAAARASLVEQPALPTLVLFQTGLFGTMLLAPAPAFSTLLLWMLPCSAIWLQAAARART